MEWIVKALDTVVGANYIPQDLSPTISVVDGPDRPVSTGLPQVPAKAKVHYWNEKGLQKAGNGQKSYKEGARPPGNSVAANQYTNVTCRTGALAQVTDEMVAEWTGGGTRRLADGVMETELQNAMDLETELVLIEVLNEIEWMHVLGNSANSQAWDGGQCDGLTTWIGANGYDHTVTAGGSSSVPTNFSEAMVKDIARIIALKYPTFRPDTILIPAELQPDFNGFIAQGAANPITVNLGGTDGRANLTGGQSVSVYNTGYTVCNVKQEPWLSPGYNPNQAGCTIIFFNSKQVKHANLIKLNREPLAKIATSIEAQVTCTYSQEHRVAQGTGICNYLKSAIA